MLAIATTRPRDTGTGAAENSASPWDPAALQRGPSVPLVRRPWGTWREDHAETPSEVEASRDHARPPENPPHSPSRSSDHSAARSQHGLTGDAPPSPGGETERGPRSARPASAHEQEGEGLLGSGPEGTTQRGGIKAGQGWGSLTWGHPPVTQDLRCCRGPRMEPEPSRAHSALPRGARR